MKQYGMDLRFGLLKILIFAFVFVSGYTPGLTASTPLQTDVLIIGAGLSGLATAYGLKKNGIKYHILEIAPKTGGRVRTVSYKFGDEKESFADSGMEEYWESNPAVQILKELNLPLNHDFSVSSIVLEKKLEELTENPEGYKEKIFSKDQLAQLNRFNETIDPILAEIKQGKISEKSMKLKDISFSKWVLDRKMSFRVSEWIRISIECEIGLKWSRIGALDGIAEYHIFMHGGEESFRVVGGNVKFTEALTKNAGIQNITLNSRVTRVATKGEEVTVSYLDLTSNTHHFIKAKKVVSTVPLYRLSEIQFEPALSKAKREAAATQIWGSYFKVHVFVDESQKKLWSRGNRSILPILSDSELGVIYDGNLDQDSPTKIVSLLITDDYAEAFNFLPLDEVRGIVGKSLEKLWPGFSKKVKGMEFYRFHPRAIAGWPVGRSRFDVLSNEMRKPENNIYFAGDFTESSHSDGAFISAQRVVLHIQGSMASK